MNSTVLIHIAEAVALGVIVAILLRLFRSIAPVRRVRGSLMLIALLLGLGLIVAGTGLPVEGTLIKIIGAIVILTAANAILQMLDVILWRGSLMQRRHITMPRLLIDLFNLVVLLVVAVFVLTGIFNVDLSALLVTSTVASAVIGLALQDMLSNVIAGLALQIEQPFRVGDWVSASGHEGRVTQMNWRTLTLLTLDNHHVTVPNANVASQEMVNYSRPEPLQRVHVKIGVGYQHPPGEVKAVLIDVARGVTGVCADPAPEVVIDEYADFSVNYDVRYWITDYAHHQKIRDEVLTRLWYAFRRHDLTIPFPIRDVNLRTVTEEDDRRSREQQRREVFDVLRPLSLFASLDDDQIAELAQAAGWQLYVADETLVRQGDPGGSLYVIKSGRVRLMKASETGQIISVGELGAGEFFGEMSLLTGEPRLLSVLAQIDTQVVVVDKAALAPVLAANDKIVEALSLALATRTKQTAERVALAAESRTDQAQPQSTALRDRMRSFFGIN